MGALFKAPAIAIYVIGALWGLWVCLSLVDGVGGTVLVIISLIIAPFILYLAPWYAVIAHGDWFPILLVYGSTFLAGGLFLIGNALDG